MNIVIAGAGTVGLGAADKLSKEGHDIVLIDSDPDKVQLVKSTVDVEVIQGDASSLKILRQARIADAGMFLALTNDDHVNIIAGMIAREDSNGEQTKIAKISDPELNDPEHVLKFNTLNIFDHRISPSREAADEIIQKLTKFHSPHGLNYCARKKAIVITQPVGADHPFAGKSTGDISITDAKLRVVAIDREVDEGEEPTIITLIPREETEIHVKDIIYLAGSVEDIESYLAEGEESGSKQVIIVGGNDLSLTVAREIEAMTGWFVKIIDPELSVCENLSKKLSKSLVLHGEGTESSLLRSEKISQCVAILALFRDQEEKNILIGLLGKSLGAKKALCLTEKSDYHHLVADLGIDATISPKESAISAIVGYIRKGAELGISFKDSRAEAIEFVVHDNSIIANSKCEDHPLSENVLIAMVLSKDGLQIAVPSTRIQPSDLVTVFTLPEHIPEVEKLFATEA
jgi:trk system potassium uptake protein